MRPKISAAELFCLCINRDIAFVVANGEDLPMIDGAKLSCLIPCFAWERSDRATIRSRKVRHPRQEL
jgi:hypothetical protein